MDLKNMHNKKLLDGLNPIYQISGFLELFCVKLKSIHRVDTQSQILLLSLKKWVKNSRSNLNLLT